jgi:hypothetical protein
MATLGEDIEAAWRVFSHTMVGAIDKLDTASTSTLIGAVLGGVIAGVTSYLVQRTAVKAARNERLDAKREAEIAVAFNTVAKVIKMFSVFRTIRGVIREALARLGEPGFNLHRPWESLQPLATLPSEVSFTSEEVAFLLATKVNAVILKALELADVYNDLLQMLRLYSDKRAAFMSALPIVIVDGRIEVAPMDKETSLRMTPLTVPLNTLFAALVGRIETDYQQARTVFDLLRAHCVQRFGKDFPRLEVIEEAAPDAPEPTRAGATSTD